MFPSIRHRYTFGELLSLITNEIELWGGQGFIEVRTVAVSDEDGTWYNFATCLRLHKTAPDLSRQRIDLDRVILLTTSAARHEVSTAEELRLILTKWRLEVGPQKSFPFQEAVNFSHYESQNRWMAGPGWVFELYEQIPRRDGYSGPSGPFLRADKGIFAESIGALAAEWLQIPINPNESTIRHQYFAVVPDERARIRDLAVSGDELRVSIETTLPSDQLFCAATIHSDDKIHRVVSPVQSETVVFPFPASRKEIAIWLLTDQGEWLDKYHESAFGSSREGISLLAVSGFEDDPTFAELQDALGKGETDRIEFKPFVKIGHGLEKAQELVETVVGFANRDGGVLYVGVTDKLEPIGVERELRREYAGECQGNFDRMEHSYVRDVRKLISEGIDVSPVILTDWVSFAQNRILKITVPPGLHKPYSVAVFGDIYIRTGANNRKLRQSDIPRYFSLSKHTDSSSNPGRLRHGR
jgi:hypothetical protein